MAKGKARTQKSKKSRDRADLIPGTLWGLSCLLILLTVLFIALGLLAALPGLLTAAFVFIAVSALSMLAMTLVTLPQRSAYDWNADLTVFPAAIRWPLQIGTWAGHVVMLLIDLFMVFSTPGGGTTVSGSTRVAMSFIAVLGAFVALCTAQTLTMLVPVLCVWGAVVAISLVRGIYGFIAGLVRG